MHEALFDLTSEAEMGHIELSRAADLLVVTPATADLLAKMAGGRADDLASTLLLATDKRVLVAPAMNVRMWSHPATQRNLGVLRGDGVLTVGPDEGEMACGEYGPGRMAEPLEIVAAIGVALGGGPLAGRHVLVTSGPTHEPIDPVRYIANRSSGAQGSALAEAMRHGALEAGVELRPYSRVERLVVDGAGAVIGAVVCELRAPRMLVEVMELLVRYGGGISPRLGGVLQATLRALERSCERHYVRARRGVILCTGGFVFDRALMLEHAPGYASCSMRLGTAGDDGSGIQIGQAAGGALGKMDRCTAWRFIDPPAAWWGGILVGRSGARICNETLYGGKVGEHLVERHGGHGSVIVDARMMAQGRAQVRNEQLQLYQRAFGVINGYLACRSAPTLRALAGVLGIDADGLEATVRTYNEGVRAGRDALGKAIKYLEPIEEGPFFGIPIDSDSLLYPAPCLTLGGLRTDAMTARVLAGDGEAIAGLYAAGRTAVGVASKGYVSGLSVADGIFSGRAAGRHAAARAGA